jgi:hypothetical protein
MTRHTPSIAQSKTLLITLVSLILIFPPTACKKSSPDSNDLPPTQVVADEDFYVNYGANNFCVTNDNGMAFTGLLKTRESYVGCYSSAFGFRWKNVDPGYKNVGGICATSDNGLMVAANLNDTIPFPYGCPLSLRKFNHDGSIAWKKRYHLPVADMPLTVRETSDKGFIVSVFIFDSVNVYPALFKINASGDSLWSVIISDRWNSWIQDLRVTSDGGFIATGGSFIVKTDSFGIPQWNKEFGWVYKPRVIEIPGGNFILFGEGENPSHYNSSDAVLIEYDGAGNKLWEHLYDFEYFDYAGNVWLTPEGGYIFTTYGSKCRAVKTDAEGTILSTIVLPGSTPLGFVRNNNHWVFLTDQFSADHKRRNYLLYSFNL